MNPLSSLIRKKAGIRNIVLTIAGTLLFFTSCNRADISGNITGMTSDTLLFYSSDINTRQALRTDTVVLKNNRFKLDIPDTAAFIRFIPKPMNKAMAKIDNGHSLMFFPGDRIRIEGTSGNLRISGSQLYDDLEKFSDIRTIEKKIKELDSAYSTAYKTGNITETDRIRKAVKEQYHLAMEARLKAIRSNPNSIASAYLSLQLDPEKGLEAIGLLSDEVRKGPLEATLQKAKKNYERKIAIKEAEQNIQPGKTAPDFHFKTLKDEEISLASFKGKYLLLDFWGTWCGRCIQGIPAMKECYAKYSKKMEILGICCNDTKQKWYESLDRYDLPWINVFDDNTGISIRYAVTFFPTKILIDPEGRIVEVFVGESLYMYKKLDTLFR